MPLRESLGQLLGPPARCEPASLEAEIREELEHHLELCARDLASSGLSPAEARREAERRFGDLDRIHAHCRHAWLGDRIMLQRVHAVLTVDRTEKPAVQSLLPHSAILRPPSVLPPVLVGLVGQSSLSSAGPSVTTMFGARSASCVSMS